MRVKTRLPDSECKRRDENVREYIYIFDENADGTYFMKIGEGNTYKTFEEFLEERKPIGEKDEEGYYTYKHGHFKIFKGVMCSLKPVKVVEKFEVKPEWEE